MSDPNAPYLLIALAFLVAGLVKGGVGLGLPPIAMALLVLAIPPIEAASLLVVPSLLTNLWQATGGSALVTLLRRFWLRLLAAALTTILGSGWLAYGNGDAAVTLLGVVLGIYAASALWKITARINERSERWLSPIVGALTGAATAITGVSSVPVIPYLQSLNLHRDDLVQAMGLSFTFSTIALAINLSVSHRIPVVLDLKLFIALVCAGGGMWVGSIFRRRVGPDKFQTFFLWALLFLGLYLVLNRYQT